MSLLAVALSLIFSAPLSWPLSSAQTIVTHLPWFDGLLPFHLETGYVEVDEEKQAHMFYYFIKSERNPAEDPLILWHTGGPMCSALSALLLEFGPLSVDVAAYNEDRSCLVNNPHSWTQMSNIIFVDAPIGTGFSYSKSPGPYKISDTKAYLHLSIFMQKWFMNHQEFMTNPLYVAGDSYAGKIVPLVAQELANRYQGSIVPLNLKGYVIGNSPGDRHYDSSHIPFAHGMGLLSDKIYESVKQNCKGNFSSEHEDCSKSIGSAFKLLKVNWAHILEPSCSIESPNPHTVGREKLPMECRGSGYFLTGLWANEYAVRQALGIREGTVPHWIRCVRHYLPIYTVDIRSNLKVHTDLTTRGYRALVYSGDHDMMMPYVGTQAWIASLNFSIVSSWRPWFVGSQVAGYTKTYSNNLTFATVKGAGHAAAEYRPKECRAMFGRWISNDSL